MKNKILQLKKELSAVILAHYYTTPEVQDVADFVGDSLALSEKAATTDAKIILFAGVHFMAETAKILSPQKTVLIPDLEAGCSLADSCPANEFAEFLKNYPGHIVISYVNTTADVKALTDIVVTSSNAVQIVDSLPKETGIVFGPDRNLGRYVAEMTGRPEMVIWDGACHVHQRFSVEKIVELKKLHPTAKLLVHPECPQPVVIMADYVGSTAALLKASAVDEAQTFIVATESGIIYEMQKISPQKIFIPAPPDDSDCSCNDCSFMKLNTLSKILKSLQTLSPELTLPEDVIAKASKPINRMLEISRELKLI